LWATSWILIKIGLGGLPPLPFAGLRYFIAFLCLLPFTLTPTRRSALRQLSRGAWLRLILLGLLFYALTQGAQFVALAYLPAITTSLLLNFTTIVVALIGIPLLGERPSLQQWGGMACSLVGVLIYFYPIELPAAQIFGLSVALVGVLANALSAILGRSVNREAKLDPLLVTVVSMGVGSSVMLVGGLITQGLPPLSPSHWLIVGWLAVVNTALAFTIWNHTLRTLSAVESSIINNTMLIQIALMAWIFLGERISVQEGIGMALVAIGVLVVQWKRSPPETPVTLSE
jgi:drug/metabolite transporter (DMT)-like permease